MELYLPMVIFSSACSAIVAYLLAIHRQNKSIAVDAPSGNDVLDLRLEREFQKGKEAGRAEERGKISLSYEPFVETIEEYMGMRKRSTLGYHMQIHYDALPIGAPTRCVTHNSVAYDEKRIDALLNSEVAEAVNGVVQLAASKGMNAKALPRKRI